MANKHPRPLPIEKHLATEKLKASGLTLEDLAELGGEALTGQAMATLSGGQYPALAGLLFRYWDPWLSEFIDVTQFHRVRILEKPEGFQVEMPRYLQLKDTLNQVYIPRLPDVDWPAILGNPAHQLIITEGELKAACATKAGFPTVGLGGVTMIEAKKKGLSRLPFFDKVEWKGRDVVIIFDSDETDGLKPPVYRAALRLAELLLGEGAVPKLGVLPTQGVGQKTGLDDFLMSKGPRAFADEVLSRVMGFSAAEVMFEIAGKFRWIRSLGCIGEIETGRLIRKDNFVIELGNHTVDRLVRKMFTNNGVKTPGYSLEVVKQGNAFLDWEARPDVDGVTYEPGKDKITEDSKLNMWQGWACQPVEGDPSPFWWALDNIFGDEPLAREFIEHWFFYPIANPGTKLYTLALVASPLEGIGKTFPAEMLARFIYGVGHGKNRADNASILQEGDLTGNYNSFLVNKQFILGDDIAGNDAYQHLARVKGLVTNEFVLCKQKYIAEYTTPNRANAYLTGNQVVSWRLTDDDRRFFVHTPRKAKKDLERYTRLRQWFEKGGAGHLLWWAQNKYDAKQFRPQAPAPLTSSRAELIELGRSDLEDWCKGLVDNSDHLTRDVATPKEVLNLYMMQRAGHDSKMTEVQIGRVLSKLNVLQWHGGKKVWHHATTVRVYVFRNPERWFKELAVDVSAEIDRVAEFKLAEMRQKAGKIIPIKRR